MLLCDFHIHSHWSDGKHSIAEVVDLFGERGFKAIAITDHVCETHSLLGKAAHWTNRSLTKDRFPAYLKEIHREGQRAKLQYDMVVIPGVEITKNSFLSHRSAHILALGITQWINPDEDIQSILQNIRVQEGLSMAAHPVLTLDPTYLPTLQLWSQRESLAHLIDAWEVASGPHLFDSVFKSGLPMIANSDLHHRKQIRSWKTLIDSKLDSSAIFTNLKNQNLEFAFFDGEQIDPSRSLRSTFHGRRPPCSPLLIETKALPN